LETELAEPEPFIYFSSFLVGADVITIIIQSSFLIMLLFLSGLISGSEVAFFSLSNSEIKSYQKNESGNINKVVSLLKTPEKLLATILILNNLINVAIITLSAYFAWGMFGKSALVFLVLTVIITLIIVFFGEIIPKVYANKNRFFFIKKSSIIINVSSVVFKPLILFLISISNTFKSKEKVLLESTTEELNRAMNLTIDKETSTEEKNILEGIINFGSIKTKEIMKSRVDMVAVDFDFTFEKIAKLINISGFSRIPVYKETIDNIEGILYVKDLIPHLNEPSFEWREKIRPAFFVPESKNIDVLFKDFQEKRVHLAVVIDEYGGVSGLVTLEDVIEEILGDIRDEFDFDDDFQFKKIDNNTYLFEGKTSLNDFCKLTKMDKNYFNQVKGESESLGGLLLELNSKIPNKGDKIKFDKFIFTIMSVDNKRIKRVRVYKKYNKKN
tara:strand:- start:7130 stop:8458 length:1329 start_codon:yes stop_codon:yes gene_type:complete